MGDSKAPSLAFNQLNTDLEKKLLGVAALEIADGGGFRGVLWTVFRPCPRELYFPFRGTVGDLGIRRQAKSAYRLILALGIVQPGLLLPLPKSGL